MERWAQAVLRRRRIIIAVWLLVAIGGVAAGWALPGRLTALTSVPGSASAAADAELALAFGDNPDGSFTVIVPFGQADDDEIAAMQARMRSLVDVIPTAEVVQQRALAGNLFALVGTRLTLLEAADATGDLRAALRAQGWSKALVTGPPALEHDVQPVLAADLARGTAIALAGAILLLLLVLGWCRAVVVPFLVGGAAVAASLLVVYLLALGTPMVLYIPNVIELIGLGLAVDYALLVVTRFRREVVPGEPVDAAVVRTMATAGRTVMVSGITAASGLAILFLMPVPFIRSLGAAGLVVPLASVLAALTLQPVLLRALGSDGVQPRGWPGLLASPRAAARWQRVAAAVVQRPRRVVAACLAGLLLAAAPLAGAHLAPASLTDIPPGLEASRGAAFLSDRVGSGALTPHTVLVDAGVPGGAADAAGEAARNRLTSALSRTEGVFVVASDTSTLFIDEQGRYQRIVVIGRDGFGEAGAQDLVERLRALEPQRYGYGPQATLVVAGAPARGVDFLQQVLQWFPWVLLASLLTAFLLMARALRSRMLAAVAVLLNLVSVAAAVGITAWLSQQVLGQGRIEVWALVFLFALLFGLSMDYQVFVVAPMREARLAGASAREAVVQGVERSAGVITAAAAVFVAALGGLVFGSISGLQQLGLGLAAGIIIDAALVRTLLLPSTVFLLRNRIWPAASLN